MPPENDRVDVWLVPLDRAVAELADRLPLLTRAETDRARRYAHTQDAADFVTVRSTLRGILGRRLGVPAASVGIREAPGRKPAVADRGIAFNVSHTRGLGIIALATAREVGVDVERVAPIELADQPPGFTAREMRGINAAVDPVAAFYRLWTLKESILKAGGHGMTATMAEIDVDASEHRDGRFRARALDVPPPSYAVALAVGCAPGEPFPLVVLHPTIGDRPPSPRAIGAAGRD